MDFDNKICKNAYINLDGNLFSFPVEGCTGSSKNSEYSLQEGHSESHTHIYYHETPSPSQVLGFGMS